MCSLGSEASSGAMSINYGVYNREGGANYEKWNASTTHSHIRSSYAFGQRFWFRNTKSNVDTDGKYEASLGSDIPLYTKLYANESGSLALSNYTATTPTDQNNTQPNAGLCINMGTMDGCIIELKSDDLADGGLGIYGFAENTSLEYGLVLESWGGTADTAKTSSGKGLILMSGVEHDGANAITDTGTSGNILAVRTRQGGATVTRFIVDAEGDLHCDGGGGVLADGVSTTNVAVYDEYNDAHLVRAMDINQSQVSAGLINSEFDKFVEYNAEKLAELKLVGREDDGSPNHFVNVTGMQRLHNGAIWQQYEQFQNLLQAFEKVSTEVIGKEATKDLLEKNNIKKLGAV